MTSERRRVIEDIIFNDVEKDFDKEKFEEFKKEIKAYSDEDFQNFLESTYISMRDEIGKDRCHVMTHKDMKSIEEKINSSSPSDYITISQDGINELSSFWRKKDDAKIVPADLFFAGTVPMMDTIVFQEYDNKTRAKARFCIYPEYQTYVEMSQISGNAVNVGAVLLSIPIGKKEFTMVIPIVIKYGFDVCMSSSLGWIGDFTGEEAEKILAGISFKEQAEGSYELLSVWYGIQISLLHPDMRKMYNNPKEDRVYDPNANKKDKKGGNRKGKPKTRIIRRYHITGRTISHAIGSHHDIKCLCWYVSGHFRHYKNGKNIFIKPYWKGALRDVKKNLDDGRIRQMDDPTNEDEN